MMKQETAVDKLTIPKLLRNNRMRHGDRKALREKDLGVWQAWTWSEIDAMEIGVYIRRSARCTQAWVEVFYTD